MDFINTLIVKAQSYLGDREEGQAMVEYGLILVLVSVVAIAALTIVGNDLLAQFGSVANSLKAGSYAP